jgi:outer membrane protein OmpU
MNIKKIGLTALGTSLIATSAFAGDMAVTGSAGINLANQSNHTSSNGWSMTDEITFTGSGEMDNGWNVTVSMQLDNNAVASTTSYMDNRSVNIDMGDMGSLTFSGHGGSSAFSAVDDVTPSAYGEAWDVIGIASTGTRTAGQSFKFGAIGGSTANNTFYYTAPTVVDGVALNIGYQPSNSSRPDGTTSFHIAYSGVEGLTIGYAQDDNGLAGTSGIDYETTYIKYAYGPVTIGYQQSEQDKSGSSTDDDEFEAVGITYQVSDNLTIGYNQTAYDDANKTLDEESTNISVSYTMGSITVAGAMVTMDNVGGSSASRDDIEGYEIDVSFAF